MVNSTYKTDGKLIVHSADELQRALDASGKTSYVYVLCRPPFSRRVVPFYIGVGQSDRLFAHEREARDPNKAGSKIDIIRSIWSANEEVVRIVDSFHADSHWRREEELINAFGLLKDGTGILANEQRYTTSTMVSGVELRKYASDGNALPTNFTRRNTRLKVGPNHPSKPNTVFGKICGVLQQHPGITGAELVDLVLTIDFSDNRSAYTQTGHVARPWVAKYIDGGFYEKTRFIQVFEDE
jgi:hypothetical protein